MVLELFDHLFLSRILVAPSIGGHFPTCSASESVTSGLQDENITVSSPVCTLSVL
jgi:hypothetical protein